MTRKLSKMAPHGEAPMIQPDVQRQIQVLSSQGWGAKRIAKELELARNTVKRYLAGGIEAAKQVRPKARILDQDARAEAERLFDGAAEGNAVVVARLLRDQGHEISVRRLQELLSERRRQSRVAQVASVRFETAPGHQAQIDFGQKRITIADQVVKVFLLVVVLSYSRRIFTKAFLAERQDDWREGIAEAFRHFGGVTQVVLGDNPRALVDGRDATGAVRFHPAYLAFAKDWGFEPRACAPYRARTKGKTEAGVKYVKRNALAGRAFTSFAALEEHLVGWMREADERVHGTTHQIPRERFERDEQALLRPLPAKPLPTRQRRLTRRVSNDALVDVDAVRYSVPHRLVRANVEVAVGDTEVRIFHLGEVVAVHLRCREPHHVVADKAHYAGLWRSPTTEVQLDVWRPESSPLETLGASLSVYQAIAEGGVR